MMGTGRQMTFDELVAEITKRSSERDAALAEVARLTAQGKELRDALERVMETIEAERCMDFNNVDITTAQAWEDGAALLSTPAGSDEPLRRVRAEAFRELAGEYRAQARTELETAKGWSKDQPLDPMDMAGADDHDYAAAARHWLYLDLAKKLEETK